MAKLCRSPDPRSRTSKGMPASRQPHKKRTPRAPNAAISESGVNFLIEHDLFEKTGFHFSGSCSGGPTLTVSFDLPSSDPTAVAVSIVVPVRNEAQNIAPQTAEIAAALDGRWAYE